MDIRIDGKVTFGMNLLSDHVDEVGIESSEDGDYRVERLEHGVQGDESTARTDRVQTLGHTLESTREATVKMF